MRNRHILWAGTCILLAFIPILNLVGILATTGVDTISNDYLMFVQQADRFMNGQNDWSAYFRDTLYTGVHGYAFLFPLRLLLLRLSNLSVYTEIYFGVGLSVLRLGLLYLLLTIFLPGERSPWYRRPALWLLPLLSALVFSESQITTFSYGETILQLGLTQIFTILGLLLLLRGAADPINAWGMALCGLLASFSGGSGLAAWPIFLLALVWFHRRSRIHYLAWGIGAALAAWPYLAYSAYQSPGSLQSLHLERLLIGLGLPLANHINYGLQTHRSALIIGGMGLALALGSLGWLVWRRPPALRRQAAPAIVLMTWGGLLAVQIMLSRLLIAPWYTTSYSLFWIGLAGLLPLMLNRTTWDDLRAGNPIQRFLALGGPALLAALALLYLRSNLTYEDKSFYLASRSPASAACLRHYATAPTYCEGQVYQWSLGNPASLWQAGLPLAQNGWSVFGPNQMWTLQGDYGLGLVKWNPDSQLGRVSWVRGAQDQPAVWSDYHHLAALIPAGQAIFWKIELPAGIDSARFETTLTRPAGANCAAGAPDTEFLIALEETSDAIRPLGTAHSVCQAGEGKPITLDLSAYAGRQITLILETTPADPGAPAVRLEFPRLYLRGVPRDSAPDSAITPINTSLSAQFPAIDATALALPVEDASGWQTTALIPAGPANRYQKDSPSANASRVLAPPVCLKDWEQFYLRTALSDAYRRKLVKVSFTYNQPDGSAGQLVMDLPLLAGETLLTYSLNLDLAGFPTSACISQVGVWFSYDAKPDPALWVEFSEAGFIPRNRE